MSPTPPRAADDDRGRGASWKTRWAALVGTLMIHALARTWRIRVLHAERLAPLRDSRPRRPAAYTFWHGQMLPMLWAHRGQGIAVLVSSHRDGEIIARIAEAFGFRTVRGSSSRGASRALLGMVRELESGGELAVTPDGPRGPAERVAPGALVAAQRAAVPVVPIAAHARRAWRLRSWDRFMIPKPFARVIIAYGDPVLLPAADAREAAGTAEAFGRLMADVAAEARAG